MVGATFLERSRQPTATSATQKTRAKRLFSNVEVTYLAPTEAANIRQLTKGGYMAIEYMCKNCGSTFVRWNTTMTLCGKCAYNKYAKPKKPIKRVGKVTQKWIDHRKKWIKNNPPPYTCYLQISSNCPKTLTIDTMTLDHVIPRSGSPELRYDDNNLKPACAPCNTQKGSKRLENL